MAIATIDREVFQHNPACCGNGETFSYMFDLAGM